jgi:hypothetical protein
MQLLARDSIRIVHIDDDNDFADLSVRGLRRAGFTHTGSKLPVIALQNSLQKAALEINSSRNWMTSSREIMAIAHGSQAKVSMLTLILRR